MNFLFECGEFIFGFFEGMICAFWGTSLSPQEKKNDPKKNYLHSFADYWGLFLKTPAADHEKRKAILKQALSKILNFSECTIITTSGIRKGLEAKKEVYRIAGRLASDLDQCCSVARPILFLFGKDSPEFKSLGLKTQVLWNYRLKSSRYIIC